MRKKLVFAIVIIILACSFLGFLVIDWYKLNYSPFKVERIKTNVIVSGEKGIGLNVDKDALYFGSINPSQVSIRPVNITNTKDIPVRVKILKDESEISDWISISQTNFILNPKSAVEVVFSCNIPSDASLGEYDGSVELKYFRK